MIAGAATFAAFPAWYATMFSGFYVALLLLLVFLITRIVSFEWRSKAESAAWRGFWTWVNAIASLAIPLIWGIAFSSLCTASRSRRPRSTPAPSGTSSPHTPLLPEWRSCCSSRCTARSYPRLCARTATCAARADQSAARLAMPAALVGAAFLIWKLSVGIVKNDQSVFPGVVVVVRRPQAPPSLQSTSRPTAARRCLAVIDTAATIVVAVATLFTVFFLRVMVSSTGAARTASPPRTPRRGTTRSS